MKICDNAFNRIKIIKSYLVFIYRLLKSINLKKIFIFSSPLLSFNLNFKDHSFKFMCTSEL